MGVSMYLGGPTLGVRVEAWERKKIWMLRMCVVSLFSSFFYSLVRVATEERWERGEETHACTIECTIVGYFAEMRCLGGAKLDFRYLGA